MRRLIVLGNCLAERLALLLSPILDDFNSRLPSDRQWCLIKVPPVYNLAAQAKTPEELADLARQCDVVFTQPLFNFGPLNTSTLEELPGIKLHTFSAPNFDAYFTDVIHPKVRPEEEKFSPPLEWHSRIFLECKAANVPTDQIEKIYFNHPLFQTRNMTKALDKAWAIYEQRENNVEIGTLSVVREFYASEPLFFTWKHPGDRIISHILKAMLSRLGFSQNETEAALRKIPFREKINQPHAWSEWGFGFNAWPIINRGHKFYNFPGRDFFRISAKEIDILTAYIAWGNYYDKHPVIFSNLLKSIYA